MKPAAKGAAIGAVVSGAAVLASLLATRPRQRMPIVDINVDRGLSDCPWPPQVLDPNGPAESGPKALDHAGESVTENGYLVLRDNERIFLAEPVREVRCVRSDPGPDIIIDLLPDRGPLGDDIPPAVDPHVIGCLHDAPSLTVYRRIRKLLRDLRVTDPSAFEWVEDWYKSNHHDSWGEGPLLPMGRAAVAEYFVKGCDDATVKIRVMFFREAAESHVCVPGGDGGGDPPLPPCPDGGFRL